jgi:hypothetical protein
MKARHVTIDTQSGNVVRPLLRPPVPRGSYAARVAVISAVIAATWFMWLSGWLGVTPGSVLVQRENVLFNSDTNVWIGEMANQAVPSAAERVIHPLDAIFWEPPCQGLKALLRMVVPADRAGLLAARIVVATIVGAGVGLLAWFALARGIPTLERVLLLMTYLLFTASSTTSLPEHFGVSNGLLAAAFVVPILAAEQRGRTAFLAALVVICGGTTITNALYPMTALYRWGIQSPRTRRNVLVVAALAVPIAVFLFIDSRKVVLLYTDSDKDVAARVSVVPAYFPSITRWYLKTTRIHGHVVDYLNLRLFRHPIDAAEYALFAVVAPAVGPAPQVRRTKGAEMVTYESGRPLHWNPNGFFTGSDASPLHGYDTVSAAGALLWVVLLATCTYNAFRDQETRHLAWLPVSWVVFNLVFHNVWGDELFLYTPHWSWALMALVLLGARHLSRSMIVALVVPIAACQIYTLVQIRNALLTIS